MTHFLFKGLPPKVVTYIKIHVRYLYSTRLFNYQEREDLIQDLVLHYLEFIKKRGIKIPDNVLFMAIKSKAMHLGRTRLRELQSGFLNNVTLDDMFEAAGYELLDSFSLSEIENKMELEDRRKVLSEKENLFIDLILNGEKLEDVRKKVKVTHNIMQIIEKKIQGIQDEIKKNEKK